MTPSRPDDPAVASVFDAAPPALRERLMALRALILETAAATNGVGPLTETLKWGEPAYLPEVSRSGSTLRIGWKRSEPERYRLLVHCQTDLIEQFRGRLGDRLRYEGRRAVVLDAAEPPPADALALCVSLALTYHRRRRRR